MHRINALRAEEAPPPFTVGEVAKSSKAIGSDEYLIRVLNLSLVNLIVFEV